MINVINRRVFEQPPGLAVSNFRILRRDVVERICGSRTAHPYITGQALMLSSNPADVLVRHDARASGTSNYGMRRIASLVLTILFADRCSPCARPRRSASPSPGFSFLLGLFYLVGPSSWIRRPRLDDDFAVLLAVLNGVVIMLLSMLGEYVVRTLNAVSAVTTYHVSERVPRDRGDGAPRRHVLLVGAQRPGRRTSAPPSTPTRRSLGPAVAARAEGVLRRRARREGARVLRRDVVRPCRRRAAAPRQEHQLISRTRRHPPAPRPCSARRTWSGRCATRCSAR